MLETVRRRRAWRASCLLLLTAALAAPGSVVAATGKTAAREVAPAQREPVDLNTADEAALTRIPGIGKAMAQRILDWRKEHGPFQRVEDLLKVKGIGEKSLEKLRPHVKVSRSK